MALNLTTVVKHFPFMYKNFSTFQSSQFQEVGVDNPRLVMQQLSCVAIWQCVRRDWGSRSFFIAVGYECGRMGYIRRKLRIQRSMHILSQQQNRREQIGSVSLNRRFPNQPLLAGSLPLTCSSDIPCPGTGWTGTLFHSLLLSHKMYRALVKLLYVSDSFLFEEIIFY